MANEKNSSKNPDLRERTHDSVDKIIDKAESMRDSGSDKLDSFKDDVSSYIKKHPEKSILIAAGAGAVVAALLLSAMTRRKN